MARRKGGANYIMIGYDTDPKVDDVDLEDMRTGREFKSKIGEAEQVRDAGGSHPWRRNRVKESTRDEARERGARIAETESKTRGLKLHHERND